LKKKTSNKHKSEVSLKKRNTKNRGAHGYRSASVGGLQSIQKITGLQGKQHRVVQRRGEIEGVKKKWITKRKAFRPSPKDEKSKTQGMRKSFKDLKYQGEAQGKEVIKPIIQQKKKKQKENGGEQCPSGGILKTLGESGEYPKEKRIFKKRSKVTKSGSKIRQRKHRGRKGKRGA